MYAVQYVNGTLFIFCYMFSFHITVKVANQEQKFTANHVADAVLKFHSDKSDRAWYNRCRRDVPSARAKASASTTRIAVRTVMANK